MRIVLGIAISLYLANAALAQGTTSSRDTSSVLLAVANATVRASSAEDSVRRARCANGERVMCNAIAGWAAEPTWRAQSHDSVVVATLAQHIGVTVGPLAESLPPCPQPRATAETGYRVSVAIRFRGDDEAMVTVTKECQHVPGSVQSQYQQSQAFSVTRLHGLWHATRTRYAET